jgi:protein SCO1/2
VKRLGIFFLILIFGTLSCSFSRPALPELGTIPDFQLLNQSGKSFGLSDLREKVWVANFIFTSCAGTCPLLTQRMKRVQDAIVNLGEDSSHYRIVSISVDPERDTPQRLLEYAQEYGARPELWSFLTGPVDQINQTVVTGFKIAMGKAPREGEVAPPAGGEIFDILHGEKFVLVDRQGKIRGYYDSDGEGITQLIRDMKTL